MSSRRSGDVRTTAGPEHLSVCNGTHSSLTLTDVRNPNACFVSSETKIYSAAHISRSHNFGTCARYLALDEHSFTERGRTKVANLHLQQVELLST